MTDGGPPSTTNKAELGRRELKAGTELGKSKEDFEISDNSGKTKGHKLCGPYGLLSYTIWSEKEDFRRAVSYENVLRQGLSVYSQGWLWTCNPTASFQVIVVSYFYPGKTHLNLAHLKGGDKSHPVGS